MTELRNVHVLAIGPVWAAVPPDDLGQDEHAGDFRRCDVLPFASGMTPPPWTDVPALIDDWLVGELKEVGRRVCRLQIEDWTSTEGKGIAGSRIHGSPASLPAVGAQVFGHGAGGLAAV